MTVGEVVDLDVVPCREVLDSVPAHGAHHRRPGVVCPGTYLHEFELLDRAAAYQAIARIAALVGVDWPNMANSIGAVSAAEHDLFVDLSAPAVAKCSGCGRHTWDASEVGRACWMPQPAGDRCQGSFR